VKNVFYELSLNNLGVRIATGYGMDGRGSISSRGKIFLFSTLYRLALVPTQPPFQWVPGALSLEVKRLGHVADYSPPTSANVKNGGAILLLPICLHGMVLN
jgi:hypothetical protein